MSCKKVWAILPRGHMVTERPWKITVHLEEKLDFPVDRKHQLPDM